jgi:hypothetical protein
MLHALSLEPLVLCLLMILVDAHVHIYDCFQLHKFLDAALDNFTTAAARFGDPNKFTALLLLTETSRENHFEKLKEYALNGQTEGRWSFHLTGETCSLRAQCVGGAGLFLIAGRQIVTAEDLEILALLTDKQFEDGRKLSEIIQTVKKLSSIPVIPWGFGKWAGTRGRALKEILCKTKTCRFFLGDNGGRLRFFPRPTHFKLAEKLGIRILPGSDPLPFPAEARRAGSFGFIIDRTIDADKPARNLKAMLKNTEISVQPFGQLEHPFRFFKNQFRMQIRKILSQS